MECILVFLVNGYHVMNNAQDYIPCKYAIEGDSILHYVHNHYMFSNCKYRTCISFSIVGKGHVSLFHTNTKDLIVFKVINWHLYVCSWQVNCNNCLSIESGMFSISSTHYEYINISNLIANSIIIALSSNFFYYSII